MESGIISLEELYSFIRKEGPTGKALHGTSFEGRAYGKKAKEISSPISPKAGFYLWGKYDKKGFWKNVYIGKAGYGKTASLQARIREELKDERVFLWRNVLSKEHILELVNRYYPHGKYNVGCNRMVDGREGTSHIIWVAVPELTNNKQVEDVENDLIETLNPKDNKKRPVPPHDLQGWTSKIVAEFRKQVHDHRKERFKVVLVE
jgi:hypothetical protein